jgi:hypothetical protein
MKTTRYRLKIAPGQAKGFSAFAEVREVIPPEVKITDAKEGLISLNTKNATKGKYKLDIVGGHTPITLDIEVV